VPALTLGLHLELEIFPIISSVTSNPIQVNHEKVWGAISSVSKACAEAGMAWGTVPPNDEYASRAAGLGCQLFLAGHDFAVIHRGIIETKNCYPSLFGEESELKREGAY